MAINDIGENERLRAMEEELRTVNTRVGRDIDNISIGRLLSGSVSNMYERLDTITRVLEQYRMEVQDCHTRLMENLRRLDTEGSLRDY